MSKIQQISTKQLDNSSSVEDRTFSQGLRWVAFRNLGSSGDSVTIKNSDNNNSFTLEAGDREYFNSEFGLNAWLVGEIPSGTNIEVITTT